MDAADRSDDSEKLNRTGSRKRQERAEMEGTTPLEIRRADPHDAQAIAEVLHASFVEFKHLYTEGGFAATAVNVEEVVVRMREGPVWVALLGGAVIGTVAAVVKDESVYIRGMAVLPGTRRTGIGVRLLEQVEKWASSERCKRLFLSTTPLLSAAIRLYERYGFRRTDAGLQDLFGTPLFTMEKLVSTSS